MPDIRTLIVACTMAMAASCSGRLLSPHAKRSGGSLCFVTAAELRRNESSSLYDALMTVRPSLLRPNIQNEPPIVIVDGAVTGDAVAALKSLRVQEIFAVRRLNASDATQRYGLHESRSVLEVITGRPGSDTTDWRASSCS